MIKRLFLLKSVIIIFLVTGCGFKVVNQSQIIDFNIDNISTAGDKRISYIIKNNLLPYSRSDGKKLLNIEIDINKNKSIKERNIKNEITKFQIAITAFVQYRSEKNGKFQISKRGNFNVSNQYSQTLNNEKKLIKMLSESIAESIIEELISRVNDS